MRPYRMGRRPLPRPPGRRLYRRQDGLCHPVSVAAGYSSRPRASRRLPCSSPTNRQSGKGCIASARTRRRPAQSGQCSAAGAHGWGRQPGPRGSEPPLSRRAQLDRARSGSGRSPPIARSRRRRARCSRTKYAAVEQPTTQAASFGARPARACGTKGRILLRKSESPAGIRVPSVKLSTTGSSHLPDGLQHGKLAPDRLNLRHTSTQGQNSWHER